MSGKPEAPSQGESLHGLASDYIHMLANERGCSAHTLRAYERELAGFSAYIAEVFGPDCALDRIEHTLIRAYLGHFKPDHHFGFEAAAWYWHFVDVVWIFLFVCVYWWGGSGAAITE